MTHNKSDIFDAGASVAFDDLAEYVRDELVSHLLAERLIKARTDNDVMEMGRLVEQMFDRFEESNAFQSFYTENSDSIDLWLSLGAEASNADFKNDIERSA